MTNLTDPDWSPSDDDKCVGTGDERLCEIREEFVSNLFALLSS